MPQKMSLRAKIASLWLLSNVPKGGGEVQKSWMVEGGGELPGHIKIRSG